MQIRKRFGVPDPKTEERITFDAFGNLTDKTVTAGSAPSLHVSVDQTTNRLNGTTYDANGNNTNGGAYMYDIENRLNELPAQGGGISYGYDAKNKRIWSENYSSNNAQVVYFYGVDGRKLATYSLTVIGGSGLAYQFATSTASMQVYFAGKLVAQGFGASISPYVQDRLGSMRYNGAYNYPVNYPAYYPYGEDKGTAAPNDQIKFATYTRDYASGLDYADQRYYSSQFGRFMTPDPYRATATSPSNPNNPQSWNRYAYVTGDPVNFYDRSGLDGQLASQDPGWCDDNPDDGSCVGGLYGAGYPCPGGEEFESGPNPCQDEVGPPQQSNPNPPIPSCSITLYDRSVARTGGIFSHTYLDVTEVSSSGVTILNDVLEGGPQFPHNFLKHPRAPWGNLVGFEEPVPPAGTPIAPNTFFLGTTNPYKNTAIGSETGGTDVCNEITGLLNAIGDYNQTSGVPYALWPKGDQRNSNSFTYTLLYDIGLSRTFTPYIGNSPGWNLLVPGLN